MKNLKNWMFSLLTLFTAVSALSQTQLTGTVFDGEVNVPLPGATIVIKGTSIGTSSDLNGKFALTSKDASGQLEISFIGYKTFTIPFSTAVKSDLGKITLHVDGDLLDDIVIMGIADIAKDRKTPVAVSTIKAAEIQEKLGSQEFPEILNTTPSVYASKGGGGFGDSRINIRGFDQKNIAVMVNGMPINDMENSSVYWSNWAGLSDVTSAMQVQRGLGSSKLAISSIGGTINILTRTSDAREGGSLSMGVGSDNYFKSSASYNTGVLDNGLSASILMSHTFGDGYVKGTEFSGSNYFLGLGYKSKNDKHNLQFTFTGAPQTHSQRYSYVTLNEFLERGENGDPNRRYNKDFGYLNGEKYNGKENFYHKPVMSLNYDWNINETTKLATVFYGSWGRGGGSAMNGRINGMYNDDAKMYDANGLVRYDDMVAWNSGQTVADFGADKKTDYNNYNTGFTKLNSVNSHDWYGTVINLNKKLGDNFTLDFGVDARTYKGYHFNNVSDLLGASGYMEDLNKNFDPYLITNSYGSKVSYNPWASKNNEGIARYNNDGNVRWYGGFTQLEYSKDNFTAFIQGAISNQDFQRIDHFVDKENPGTYKDGTTKPEWKTSWKSILGGNVKGGVNYNINDNHNVFGNVGYYSKQPFFNGVYINNTNVLNPDLMNEKIFGIELGYGFRSSLFNANVNLYRTSWEDRIERRSTRVELIGADGKPTSQSVNAQLNGLSQLHQGVEVDFSLRPIGSLTLNGSFSYGDWKYTKDVDNATILDRDTNEVILDENGQPMIKHLYLDGSRVGDAPQLTASLGVDYRIVGGLKLDATYRFVDKLYSKIDVMSAERKEYKGALELPSFNLFDLGMTYKMEVGKDKQNSVVIRANVNNVFDKIYIAESGTSNQVKEQGDFLKVDDEPDTDAYQDYLKNGVWNGIDTSNQVWFGTGRTWNLTLRYNF